MSDSRDILFDLLKAAQRYYPVDLPGLCSEYTGREEFYRLVHEKIVSIQSGEKTNWSELVTSLSENIELKIYDMGFQQFPSYQAYIEVFEECGTWSKFETNIKVYVSLLCSYYTVFLEDSCRFNDFHSEIKTRLIPRYRVYYLNSKATNRKTEMLVNVIKEKTEKHFTGYTFAPHDILLQNKVPGLFPYTWGDIIPPDSYPLFGFLFDGSHVDEDLLILK